MFKLNALKDLFYTILILLCFFIAGFVFALLVFRLNQKVIKDYKVIESIKYITNFSERLYTNYKYIDVNDNNTNCTNYINLYNSLLTESREALKHFDIVVTSYNKLKNSQRDLYFLFGGGLEYSIKRTSIDAKLAGGIEYKKVGILAEYSFLSSAIGVLVYYRF